MTRREKESLFMLQRQSYRVGGGGVRLTILSLNA